MKSETAFKKLLEQAKQAQKSDNKGSVLNKALYLADLDKIALVEERCDTVQFIVPRTGERAAKDLDCLAEAQKLVRMLTSGVRGAKNGSRQGARKPLQRPEGEKRGQFRAEGLELSLIHI